MKKKSFRKKFSEGNIRDYQVYIYYMGKQERKILHCPKRNIITRFAGTLKELYEGFKIIWEQGYIGFSPTPYEYPFPKGNKGEPIIKDFIRGRGRFPNGVQYAKMMNSDICLLDEKGIVISDRYPCMKPLGGPYDVFRTDTCPHGYSGGYLVTGGGIEIISYDNIEPCGNNCYKFGYKVGTKNLQGFIKFTGIGEEPEKKPYVKPILKRQAIYSPLYGYLGLGK